MKKLLIISTFVLVALSCKKEAIQPQEVQSTERISVSEVKKFLTHLKNEKKSNTGFNPASILNSINWNDIKQTPDSLILFGRFKGQPFDQYLTLGYRQAIFYKDSLDQITIKIMEVLPDLSHLTLYNKINPKHFSGKMFFYDSDYNLEGGIIYQDGKVGGSISKNIPKKQTSANTSVVVTQCHVETGAYFNAEHVLILFAYNVCTTYDFPGSSQIDEGDFIEDYTDDNGYYESGGSTANIESIPEPELPGIDKTPVDIKKFLDCFQNISNNGASYRIDVYVQEPWSNTMFNIGPNGVGHVAIGLTKTGSDGSSITQVIGFYPSGSVFNSPGEIHNNGGDNFNVSMHFNINGEAFSKMNDYLNMPLPTYNLFDSNCASFAYGACLAGGITLPSPINSVGAIFNNGHIQALGYAMSPAGLGGNMRELKEHTQASNINDNINRSPASKGKCD